MKTGKKILALLLVFCFMMAAVPAYAASFSYTITGSVDNELWGRWDSEASIKNVTVTVKLQNGAIGTVFADAEMDNLRKNATFKNEGYAITLPDLTFGNGENTITVPGGKFKINTDNGLWVTTYLTTTGPVAAAMVEESKTNEELRALLTIDPETDAASLKTGSNVFNGNIYNYIKYKIGAENMSVTTDQATLHAGKAITVNGDFPLTTFMLSENQITTFVGGETPVQGAYVYSLDGNTDGLYVSSRADSGLDGPYAVFTAPATGTYDVHVLKRDDKDGSNPKSRHIVMEIAGQTMNFGNSNVSNTMGYQWQNEDNHTPVYLTKGQQVPVRVLAETGYYSGAYGFAFTPRTDAETPVTVQYNATPTGYTAMNTATIKSVIPAAETATITVDGEEVAVTAGAAETYYPNVRKSDANGNYINKPTLLDALVTLDKQEDIGIDAHVLTESGYLHTYETDTMAFSPTTAPLFGYNLPGNAGDYYANVFSASETFNLASGTGASIAVKVPEDGTYYMIANGGHWDTGRSISVKVDSTSYSDGTDTKFCFGGLGVNAHYDVQSANGIELTAGYHTLSFSVTGATRLSYVALVKADSQEEAAAIQATFGKGEKDKFNEYFNDYNIRNVFNGSTIEEFLGKKSVSVNGEIIKADWDRYILEDGDVIRMDTFEPVSVGPLSVYAYTSNMTWDSNRQLTDETSNASNFALLISNYGKVPADTSVKDSMRGMYLTGYVTFVEDDAATTGDETKVVNYIQLPIQGNAISQTRLVVAINQPGGTTTIDGLKFNNLNGGFADSKKYDATHLYITDDRFDGTDASVNVVCENGKVVISSKKSQPVFVIVNNADGTKASATNYALDITTPVEVEVTAGQTVYVWEGSSYLASGTTARPLCAPIVVE